MTIGITGASGQLGASTVKFLLERVQPGELVAITRDPSKLDALAKNGVGVRAGDFAKPDTLSVAFQGVEKLLIIPTSDLGKGVRRRQHEAAVKAAAEAGVKHAVYVSIVNAHPGPDVFDSHFAAEQALFSSGMKWTFVRMNLYAENLIGAAKQAVASGVYATTTSAPVAYVVRDEIARLAAGVLATSGHEYMTYHATGPVAVAPAEIADTLSRISGKSIKSIEVAEEQYRQGLTGAGLPEGAVNLIIDLEAATKKGVFNLVSGDIELLTGKEAESVLDYYARSKALFTTAA